MSHTPTPWYRGHADADGAKLMAVSALDKAPVFEKNCFEDQVLAYGETLGHFRLNDNLEHAIKCVNAHDELVAALRAVQQAQRSGDYAVAFAAVDAALAKVAA